MKKRIIYVIIFVVVVLGVIGLVVFFNNATTNRDETSNKVKIGSKTESTNTTEAITTIKKETVEATVTELDDGTLYQVGEPLQNIDLIIGDKFFETQINDIYINTTQYLGKTIEIEGLYYKDPYGYTIVGRYSNANLCQYCQGFPNLEYEWNGNQTPPLVNDVTWIKLKGTLTRGEDDYGEYYYIAANSLEVMNERGIDTVNN